MILFAAIGIVMLASALWVLLWPLLTRATRTTIPRRDLNVRIARQRLAEIEIELENKQLSDADFRIAVCERLSVPLGGNEPCAHAVSYTHLTLPTSDLV